MANVLESDLEVARRLHMELNGYDVFVGEIPTDLNQSLIVVSDDDEVGATQENTAKRQRTTGPTRQVTFENQQAVTVSTL